MDKKTTCSSNNLPNKNHRISFHKKTSKNTFEKIPNSTIKIKTPVPKIKSSLTDNLKLKNFDEIQTINEEFNLIPNEKLGGGSFGLVYKCQNIHTKKFFAAKIESNDSVCPQLKNEFQMLKLLKNGEGFPTPILLKNSGMDTIMILDLLGPNLEDILHYTKAKKFSLQTSIMIFIQILSRLKFIHENKIIHRDLKPENFLVDSNTREKTLYLVDFGLAKKFVTSENKHIPFKKNRPIAGTVRFISLNTHKGFEQSRRDDVESLVYILMYHVLGQLPWDNVKCKNKEEKYEKIFEIKNAFKFSQEFKKLPDEIKEIYEAVLLIEFEAKPNYDYYENLAEKCLEKFNENDFFDDLFDWQKIEFMVEPIFMINDLKKKKNEEIKEFEMKLEDDEKINEKNVEKNTKNENKKNVKRNNKRRLSSILPMSYQLKNLKK